MVDGVAPTGGEPALVGGPDGVPLAVGADGVQAIKTIESTPTKEIARPRIGPMVSPPRLAFHLLDVEMMRTVPADYYADADDRWRRFGVVTEQAFAFLGKGRCLAELPGRTKQHPSSCTRAKSNDCQCPNRTISSASAIATSCAAEITRCPD